MRITSDKLQVGDKYDSLVVNITDEMNKQFLKALDDFHPRYNDIIHPGLLMSLCSITKSPSFNLSENVAAVGAKFDCTYLCPAKVGKKYTLAWEVTKVIEKRSRMYQISDVLVTDEAGKEVMRRSINNTFIGGEHLQRRVEWEKKMGFKREPVTQTDALKEGYEIVGKPKKLNMEKLQYYSGGPIGSPTWPAQNIHTSREISIRSGIGKPIASGMMFEAFITELMIDFFGDDWFEKGKMAVICIEMAGDGDTIIPKAIITNKFQESKSEISLKIWCENQNRNVIIIGSATYKM